MKDSSRSARTSSRGVFFVLVLATIVATAVAADPNNAKKKSFGHKNEPVTLGPAGKGRLTAPNPGRKPVDVAVEFARKSKDKLGLTDDDLTGLQLEDEYTDSHNGVTHVYLRQQIDGLEVVDADLATHLTKDGEVITVSSTLVKTLRDDDDRGTAALSAAQAAAAAAASVELTLTEPLEVRATAAGPQRETTLGTGGIASEPITARLVYQPVAEDRVRLAWSVDIAEASGEHWWKISVDAETGAVLSGDDYVDHDNWGHTVPDMKRNTVLARTAATRSLRPAASATVADGSAYRVFAQPLENPNDGATSLVLGPAEAAASPYGWHDADGATGPEFTRTRGNNVHAYTDIDANNVADAGSDPDGGPSLQFNFPFNPALAPASNRPPAVVNLFYWNNIVHDVYYQYGFDELSGNFQVNNYGRGPAVAPLGANDDVRAEAQDGSGTNNANFFTPSDGSRPRMQMFVWSYPFINQVVVHPPSAAAGTYGASGASFGPPVTAAGWTGDVVVGLDASDAAGPSTTDGCSAFTNAAAVAGKIALVDRGSCNFTAKVHNAQLAGAIAVIVGNNTPANPSTMGFTAPIPTITIPSVMVSLAHADLFKANVPLNATVQANPNPPPSRDSDFDAGVIAHEYGHGISNRLTGGRTVTNCLNNQEQMGEGWSDWLAIVLTTHPSDTGATPRGVGTYLIFQTPTGNGIRPTPYSTDMTVNPSTYNTIKTAAVPHGVGYVWSTMLWEMYWNLVAKHGYTPDIYDAGGPRGNTLAVQLVMDGMKLQPCRPGFVSGRNAILQADVNLTGGANQCEIWRAFAKRGLGIGASEGSTLSVADGVESFVADDVPPVISNVSVDPATLWAPNHKMVDVTVSYDVTDGCSRTNAVTTTLSVTSNEPVGSNEQGDVNGDWEVVNDHLVRLRAERLGAGTGRIYTITITATDGDGNSSTATVTVTVPRDQS